MIRLDAYFSFVLLVSLSLIAQGQTSQSPKDTPATTDTSFTVEDSAIATAALLEIFGEAPPEKLVLIDQTSVGVPPGMAAMTRLGGKAQPLLAQVPKEAKEQFETRNKSHLTVDPGQLKVSFQMVMATPAAANKIVEGGAGWESFRSKFPNAPGITLLSLPGVSSDRTKAMIYIGTSCGTTCGTGYLILLGKDGDHWKVLDKVMIWIS